MYSILDSVDRLIIVGYGFNDLGVNMRVIPWVRRNGKRLLVVDPKTDQLEGHLKRRCFGADYGHCKSNGSLRFVRNAASSVGWGKIKRLIR
jgi:hypothetical protein